MTLFVLLAMVPHFRQVPIVEEGAKLEKVSGEFSFTEGPAVDRKGDVYFTDQPNDRIVKWTSSGKLETWLTPCGRANGMAIDRAGNLIACADELNQLVAISTRTKKITTLIPSLNGHLMNGPNDIWIHPNGNLYITDPLYPRPYWKRDPKSALPGQFVYVASPDGKKIREVATDLKQPNGIVGTKDGKTLYVADIGAWVTFRYDIAKNGDLVNKTKFCNMGSDGMSIDDRGNVYLTGKGVTVFDPHGKQIEHIDIPEEWTANVTFGGRDFKTLFITASKGIYTLKMRVQGADSSQVR